MIVLLSKMTPINWLSGPRTGNSFSTSANVSFYVRITNKHSPIVYTYNMDSITIKQVPSAKYLGITINEKLNWSKHISIISSSALGFLSRNLKFCPLHIKESCYKSLVIPILEYACIIWDPHTQKDILNLE